MLRLMGERCSSCENACSRLAKRVSPDRGDRGRQIQKPVQELKIRICPVSIRDRNNGSRKENELF